MTNLQIAELRAGKPSEVRRVLRVIDSHGGNITQAAKALGVGLRTLQRWRSATDPRRIHGLLPPAPGKPGRIATNAKHI